MTLSPHAPIFRPKYRSRFFSIYRPELLTATDTSTSQDIADPMVADKCSKTSPNPNSHTVSEQLHPMTAQADQFRITST